MKHSQHRFNTRHADHGDGHPSDGSHHNRRRNGRGHGRGRGPGGGGPGGGRARRGAVAASVLALLDEQPMHGYELITALEERSDGKWRPSPGAIYPALGKLEERGLISSHEDDGKRRFELTDSGRERLAEQRDAGIDAPWEGAGRGRHGELRRAVVELTGPARQIGRFGTQAQSEAAADAIKQATATLYRILADGPAADDDESDTPADKA